MTKRKGLIMRQVFIALMFGILLSGCTAEEKYITLMTETQHDDYFYSIIDFKKYDEIGGIKPQGVFFTVTFRVNNRAKKVNHPWDNDICLVRDKNNKEYRNLPEAQKKLNQLQPFNLKDKHVTAAGETESTVFVFDLPRDAEQPCIMYNGEFLMGDLFDGCQFKHTHVKLY